MAHLEHKLFFEMEKSYLPNNVERIYKIKYEKMTKNGQNVKSKVTPDSGKSSFC